jgi:hypothetical protein
MTAVLQQGGSSGGVSLSYHQQKRRYGSYNVQAKSNIFYGGSPTIVIPY